MNQEERDIRLLEYWQGESLSSEEVREVESWLGEKEENKGYFESALPCGTALPSVQSSPPLGCASAAHPHCVRPMWGSAAFLPHAGAFPFPLWKESRPAIAGAEFL